MRKELYALEVLMEELLTCFDHFEVLMYCTDGVFSWSVPVYFP